MKAEKAFIEAKLLKPAVKEAAAQVKTLGDLHENVKDKEAKDHL